MKKFFVFIIAGILCVSAAGCGKKAASENGESVKTAVEKNTEKSPADENVAKEEKESADEGENIKNIPPQEESLAEFMVDGDLAGEDIIKAERTVEDVIVYGEFTAAVRALLPDYVLDGETLSVAVVTLFQDGPFTLYLGVGGAKDLEVGGIYTFEIEETALSGENTDDLEYIDPSWFLAKHNIRIKNIRRADEDREWGLICNRLDYRLQ